MNVLYVAPFASPWFTEACGDQASVSLGGSRKVELISRSLAALGHNVLILSSHMASARRLGVRRQLHEQLSEGVSVLYPSALTLRPIGGLVSCLRARALARRACVAFRPDALLVYNTYLFETLAASEAMRQGVRRVVLEIEDLPMARRRGWLNLKPRIDQRCWREMVQRATAFTAVNGHVMDLLPADRQKHLLPGIIDEALVALGRHRRPPFSGDERVLGYFGGLGSEKGSQVLIDLVPRLPDGWRMVVSGSGPFADRFEQLSRRYVGRLDFLGRVSDEQLYQAMCGCDCTVIPQERLQGGGRGVFPFKVLEYLVAGTHIISSPLSPLAGLDLSFVQRWDGASVDDLLRELARADASYAQERTQREAAVGYALSRYRSSAVGHTIAESLSGGGSG